MQRKDNVDSSYTILLHFQISAIPSTAGSVRKPHR